MSVTICPGRRLHAAEPHELDTGTAPDQTITALWGEVGETERPVVLGFADDGLIWGVLTPGGVRVAHDADPGLGPPLRWLTLQRAHVFAAERELRLWREDGAFRALWLTEAEGTRNQRSYDEDQVLFGWEVRSSARTPDGVAFTAVEDRGGEWHAPPIEEARFVRRGLRLQIRNYLEPDAHTGMLRVRGSRLVALRVQGG